MDSDKLVISAISGVTPIGGNIEQTCCAIRAGINLFEEHELFECEPFDSEWDPPLPLVASAYPFNDPLADGFTRMLDMAIQSLKEIVNNLKFGRKNLARCGLLIALPEQDKVTDSWQLQEKFINTLCGKTGLSGFSIKDIVFQGRTGGLQQLQSAMSYINSGQLDYCIIAGVDSFLADDRIQFFDKNWRIKSDRSADGFIPGEASVMFAIEKDKTARARGINSRVSIETVAFGHECNAITGDKQSTGTGCSEVLDKVMSQVNATSPIEWTISDMNGESYTGREWGTVLVRNTEKFSPNHQLDHPVDCVGELGAAMGTLMVSMAVHAFSHDYHKANEVYLTNSADNGDRAAALLKQI